MGVRDERGPFRDGPLWWLTKDGDRSCRVLAREHYSAEKNKAPKNGQFVGPGHSIVLRTERPCALFVWRKFVDDCIDERTGERQVGVNCAIFRNKGPHLSSHLIRQADAIADQVWPGERHYTYVNEKAVRSTNPGYCFMAAGWRRCGKTKGKLLVLERV